jgi:CheY-like chemotaxis protein
MLACYDKWETATNHPQVKRGFTHMRFLIVDDTSRARQSMKALLEVWHPHEQVYESVNGIEAIRMVSEIQPDLVLMDARMPEMTGLEATRRIKQEWTQVKVIILSVFMDYQMLALEAGADGFVNKSDPPEKLREMIETVIQKKGGNNGHPNQTFQD